MSVFRNGWLLDNLMLLTHRKKQIAAAFFTRGEVKSTLLASLLLAAMPALGATASGSVEAMTVVPASCHLGSGTLIFGNYDPVEENRTLPLDGTGSFTIRCAKGVSATIAIGPGLNSAYASGTSRAMEAGGNYLSYELYTSASRSTVWDTGNTVAHASTSKNATSTVTIWGRIPAGQHVPGNMVYSDTATITATF